MPSENSPPIIPSAAATDLRQRCSGRRLALWLIIAAGLALRLFWFMRHDFWHDEIAVIQRVSSAFDPAYRAAFAGVDKHPPLYYIVIAFWYRLFQGAAYSLRLFSVILSTAGIPLIYRLGRRINAATALLAAALLSVNAFHLWYAQEARMYAPAVFCSLLCTVLLFRAADRDRARDWILYLISCLLMISTLWLTALLVPAHGVALGIAAPRRLKSWLISISVLGLGILPIAIVSLRPQLANAHTFWLNRPRISDIPRSIETFWLGYSGTRFWYRGALALQCVAAIAGLLPGRGTRQRCAFFCLATLPLLIIFTISLRLPVYLDRHLIVFSPYLFILTAAGLCRLPWRPLRYTAITLCIALLLFGTLRYYNGAFDLAHMYPGVWPRRPIQPVAAYLARHTQPGDSICFSHYGYSIEVRYYFDELTNRNHPARIFYAYSPGIDIFFEQVARREFPRRRYTPINITDQEERAALSRNFTDTQTIWHVASSWHPGRAINSNGAHVTYILDRLYQRHAQQQIAGAWVTQYKIKQKKQP